MQECPSTGVSGDALRVAGIWDASRVSSMLPWKGLGMSSATARTTGLRDKLAVAPMAWWWISHIKMGVGHVDDVQAMRRMVSRRAHEQTGALRFVLPSRRPLQLRSMPARDSPPQPCCMTAGARLERVCTTSKCISCRAYLLQCGRLRARDSLQRSAHDIRMEGHALQMADR